MEKLVFQELLESGIFVTLFVGLGWYVIKRNDNREDKLTNLVEETNKINLNVTATNKELSKTNTTLAEKLTNEVNSIHVKIEHMDDKWDNKFDDLKDEVRSNKK